jgi:predicted double-glycine peptidase
MRENLLFTIAFIISISSFIGPTYGASNNILFHVPDTRQSFDYSCAASALQSVLVYWGIDIGENELIKLLNTTSAYGTDENDIVRVARQMGLEAELKDNITLADLEQSIDMGIPVIVNCQSWRGSAYSNASWANDCYDGHYLVVIGIDEKNVYLEDPYMLGSRGFIQRQEFLERWHNSWNTDLWCNKTKQYHLGIFIRGDKPSPPRQFIRIDGTAFNLACKNASASETWDNKGNASRKMGKYNDAIAAYDRAIELNPKLAEAWYGKGEALFDLEKYCESINAYDIASYLKPEWALPLYGKGKSLDQLGLHEDANQTYYNATELDLTSAKQSKQKQLYAA